MIINGLTFIVIALIGAVPTYIWVKGNMLAEINRLRKLNRELASRNNRLAD